MKRKVFFCIYLILLISSSVFCRDLTIPLVWNPSNDLSDFKDLKLGKLSSVRVQINEFKDQRVNKSEIGKNIEKSFERFYYTNYQASYWARDRFIYILQSCGINIVKDRPDIILNVDLIRFYVIEGGTYKGDVALKISATDNQHKEIWTGAISGSSSRWGSSFSPENYYECIGNSFIDAVKNLLQNESFIAAVNNLGQPMRFDTTTVGMAPQVSTKKRIAVFDFTDKSDHTIKLWQSEGQGLSDMCITALVKSGKYIVVERGQLEQLSKEQALGASGALTEGTAAQIGKMLGAEVALFGTITEFGYKKRNSGGNAPVPTPFGFSNVQIGVNTLTAFVAIDVRLVNTSTGEIVAAETVSADESNTGISISDAVTSFNNQTSFDQSLIGKASRKAIDNLVSKIDAQMEAVKWEGCIVKCDNNEIIINAGSTTGIRIGDTLKVFSKGEDLIDPVTGLNIGNEEKTIGTIKVISDIAQGKASKCVLINGVNGKRGDIVRY